MASTSPYPSDIIMSKPYLSENAIQQIQAHSVYTTYSQYMTQANAAFKVLEATCKTLMLPARSFGTAMVLFSRYCLLNKSLDGTFEEVLIACLVCACKIEDTAKRVRDVHAAVYSYSKVAAVPFDACKPQIMELELQILETVTFDFRIRHPQPYIIKIAKALGASKDVARLAWTISLDTYRTHMHMKRPPHTIALSCLILAGKLSNETNIFPIKSEPYNSDRLSVNHALLDLLDLYMIYLDISKLGEFNYEKSVFSQLRIAVSKEVENARVEEHTVDHDQEQIIAKELIRDKTRSDKGTVRYVLDWEIHQLGKHEEVN
ncbi:CTD kinase subunit beta [Yarrowia sp. E02]|nr:CTD kinase subunit beta [Yarrowia sp. E02]